MTDETSNWSRRDLLTGSLAFGLAAGAGPLAFARPHSATAGDVPGVATPEEQLRQIVRMQGSLAEEDVPWWFTGVIFALPNDRETPRPLVRFEGMEIYWFRHVPDGYILGGNTVTFFRDFETNAYLYEFQNPWTGRRNMVRPAVQGGGLGFRYSVDGIWPVKLTGEALVEPPRNAPLTLQWHAMRDSVWLQHQTVYPPGAPPMHGQRQTMFVGRREFADARIRALPSVFSSTVFMGWLRWMEMKEQPGHVVWHASGAKLRSLDELPREYRERCEREYPERMTGRPPAASASPSPAAPGGR